ncbi:phenylacetate-CoA oxygenase subunit PaaI [Sagittula sp. NFXS13]|uniref:Phenylacetic acid catabolic protein n=1 Tax=Sagittula sp. NFXS13 TaxID=2819095 RepID=UPI0032DE5895
MTNEAADTMSISDYLAQGGKLSSPENVPPRYRAELLRLMSSFVDSELAGSAGFADAINWAPGIKERIAASRITLEKADHAERVLDLMVEFGTDKALYNSAHDWAARMPRDADVEARRQGGDMRLSVFHHPLENWNDAVILNVLMGQATVTQLRELEQCSYAPLAEVARDIIPREQRHMELGLEGLARLTEVESRLPDLRKAIDYWQPRVALTFGRDGSDRFDRLSAMGLRRTANEALRTQWQDALDRQLATVAL